MNKNNLSSSALVLGIIVLFIGASIVSAINVNVESVNVIDEVDSLNHGTETFHPTDDTFIRQGNPDKNFGSLERLAAVNEYGSDGSGYATDSLIKFDISSIPQDAIPVSATLKLYYSEWSDTNPAGRQLNAYRITNNWDEDTVTWNTQPTYVSQPTTFATVPSSAGVWMEWDVTEDVQDFVTGQEANYGWKITDENYWGKVNIPRTRFRSKENGNYTPYLEIDTVVLNEVILIGRITNVNNSSEDFITFKAEFLRFIQLSPFKFNRYTLGEEITVDKSYAGILTTRFAFGIFNAGL